MFSSNSLTVRTPTLLDRVQSRVLFGSSYADRHLVPSPDAAQSRHADELRREGTLVLERYLAPARLAQLQAEFAQTLNALEFEMPTLAQSRVDPARHTALIDNFMFGTPAQLREWGVAFDRAEAASYEQVVRDFNPSTLTAYMLERSAAYREAWLDPFLLGIVTEYLGLVPRLAEAYMRRNFPAPHRTMNHFWHRDLNTPFHLVKVFFFLTDCDVHTGPHEFVRGSHRRLDALNGKRYFTDTEVDAVYAPNSRERLVSSVPAGTVIIEDTRGLHRAALPETGFRDLGYATFMPLRPFYPHRNYALPRAALDTLSPFQRAFVPGSMVV